MNVIEVEGLTKKFKDFTAVDHVSFAVQQGEIFGFLGPNGAGKSTTISMLATLLNPTEGTARVAGFDVRRERDQVRRSIGMVFQDPSLDSRLTAEENLLFHARLYHVPAVVYRPKLEEMLKLVDLADRRDSIVKTFSGGMKRRLEIARGFLHTPQLLILDEPTIGLDPQTRRHLWDYVLKLQKERGMTIFMTTHYMDEAEYCNRIAIMDHGKIVAIDTPDGLKARVGGDIVRMQAADMPALKLELERRYTREVKELAGYLQMEVENGERFLPKLIGEMEGRITAIELRKPTLDDVFLLLTGRDMRAQEASATDRMRMWRARMGR